MSTTETQPTAVEAAQEVLADYARREVHSCWHACPCQLAREVIRLDAEARRLRERNVQLEATASAIRDHIAWLLWNRLEWTREEIAEGLASYDRALSGTPEDATASENERLRAELEEWQSGRWTTTPASPVCPSCPGVEYMEAQFVCEHCGHRVSMPDATASRLVERMEDYRDLDALCQPTPEPASEEVALVCEICGPPNELDPDPVCDHLRRYYSSSRQPTPETARGE